ncbi:MAG TPA: TlpA disulfide reductase family protein [Bryobacteraceae bacterium]|jgi:thiol-disulfide isomerase/thioredoxin|nr:TlpA disulfide reductase family protein [Bryobacteraceae bacterium]
MRTYSVVLFAAVCPALFAQSPAAIPGCEARPEVRQAIDDRLADKALENMKFSEQLALKREVLGDLIAKYPRELEPYRQLIQATRYGDPAGYAALAESYIKQAEQHPDDPLALYVAALVSIGRDTPRSIQYLERAEAEAPDFGWPAISLARVHATGKLADKKKAAAEAAAFFTACPSSTDPGAQRILNRAGGTELQARVAAALRARLAKETAPKQLEDYATLWGLEFRSHPTPEHDALRRQVAEDLQRLESMNPKPDAEWLAFLKDGYKQSGASTETVTAKEDQVIRAFPHSEQAYDIVYERWKKAHKEPEDQKDVAAWRKYDVEQYAAVRSWIAQFTEDREVQHLTWFYTIFDDPDISEKEGLRALNDFLAETSDYQSPQSWNYRNAASFLIYHKWQPERAIELARTAEKWEAITNEVNRSDNLSSEDAKDRKEQEIQMGQDLAGLILRAARLAGNKEEAERMKGSIETSPPDDVKVVSGYWANRARLAAVEGRKADALTFYQQAIYTRERTPELYHGRLIDNLMDEASAVWKDTGGTEAAWNVWKTPPAGKAPELAEGRWEKAAKAMPAFELADLAGKTWRLKSLEGKSVLINVWATWCGPCQGELPKLEKLYEKVKDRPDIQIVTLNIDQDLGLVAPFVKDKGFTFPVLPAYSFVLSLLDSVGIPQNWILDPKGAWRLTQLGYDASDAQWADTMIGKLQSVKTE